MERPIPALDWKPLTQAKKVASDLGNLVYVWKFLGCKEKRRKGGKNLLIFEICCTVIYSAGTVTSVPAYTKVRSCNVALQSYSYMPVLACAANAPGTLAK